MFYSKFSGLFGRSSAHKRTRPARTAKRFSRSMAYIQLEDRLMLASILGTADGFAVLAGSTVTNTGPSIITGNVGVSPGSAVVGFPPGILTPPSVIHAADAVAAQAQSDVTVAYNDLAGRASNFDLTGQDLGGLTLTPGVYTFATSAQLTGTLTLDAQGVPDAEFVFQIGSTLTTASNSSVVMINSADSCNVYWQVGSSATLGTNTDFAGNILALTSVTLNTGADILNGRALAQNGAVTLDDNEISIDGCASITWEKRATDADPVLLAGASFSISPNPQTGVGTLMVVDGGANDADGLANGVLEVIDVLMGTYIVTETAAPPGYFIDDDATRSITVTPDDFHAVIGVLGVDDIGNTDESDFHNRLSVGSIAWEKRDNLNALQGGATFTISPDPTDGVGDLTIVDNGPNDDNPVAGQILVNDVPVGSYIVTETVAPAGFAIDDDPTRGVTVTLIDPVQVIGVQGVDDPGNTDESDFHNRLGSISWEKRASDGNPVLLPGATFEISPNPLTGVGTLTVVDGGVNDADGLANGVLQVNNVLLGTYTITETIAPVGYALDDDPTRSVTVSAADLNAVIGVQGTDQPGNTDESDFHNRLGSISWEKRASDGNPVLLPGATFEISPNPLTGVGTLTVVDGGINDADGLANGVLQVNNVLLGTYTITETIAPMGYALDDDPTRSVTVSAADLNAVIGVQGSDQPGNTDESDFHNRLGSISWEKRTTDGNPVLLPGATFSISPNPLTGAGTLTVVDGGLNDADGLANGVLQVNNVLLGTYTVTETIAPVGYALDDDVTRSVTVSAADLNAVIGVQGTDQPGNTDESDFHNRLGSISWEKRASDGNPVLLPGATFEISPNPLTGVGTLTVVDGGINDADGLANGVLQVNNVLLGTYTITETIAPVGYALDDDVTRSVTVSAADLNAVIGVQGTDQPGNTDESDFHNVLGSIAWEKRATDGNPVLLPGATFEISPNPLTGIGTLTVVDGGINDADGLANGVLQVNNVLLGTYTITETIAPVGYALDDDVTRSVTVSAADLNAVVGVQGTDQPGNTDESDFHNRLGSISWEKRASDGNPVLLPGATFSISPNPLTGVGSLTVVDGGANDADGLANGVLQVNNVLLGTYTITETIPPVGYALDDDVTRSVTVSAADLNAVIGVQGSDQPGNTDESDFHNFQILALGSIAWEKRDQLGALQGGVTFTVTPDSTDGVGILTILDNGPGDADPDAGQILVNDVLVGSYVVAETVPPAGFIIDDDPTRSVTVTVLNLNQVIGVQGVDDPGNTDESDFHNRLLSGANVFVIGMAKSPSTPQFVRVVDQESGAILTEFAPYGDTFRGGVRVATGDLTGDGIDEIVTAPGWSIVADVRVYDLNGVLITSLQPYGPTFNGGVQIAVADVDGDGVNDIITVPSYGPSEVKVFRNELVAGIPTFDALNPYRDFLAFPASFIGGAVVEAADMGTQQGASFNTTLLDQRAEIVVGSGPGIQTTVKVFDVSGMAPSTPTVVPTPAGSFTPFTTGGPSYQGGVSLSVARINPDLIPDITVGAGVNGRSLVDVWAWSNSANATLASLSANGVGFFAFTDSSRNAPVQVAAQDEDGDGIAETILAVQGPGGTSAEIRAFQIVNTAPLEVAPHTTIPGDFPGPYFIAPSTAQVTDLIFSALGAV